MLSSLAGKVDSDLNLHRGPPTAYKGLEREYGVGLQQTHHKRAVRADGWVAGGGAQRTTQFVLISFSKMCCGCQFGSATRLHCQQRKEPYCWLTSAVAELPLLQDRQQAA